MAAAPPLVLSEVDFVVRNKSRRHALRLDATPPTEWGQRFTVAGAPARNFRAIAIATSVKDAGGKPLFTGTTQINEPAAESKGPGKP